MKPYSDARRRRDAHYQQARQAVYERAQGRCEVMAFGCEHTAAQVHHKRGRTPIDGDDPHDLDLLVAVCRACHAYIEEHRSWAYERGWLVSRLGQVRPSRWTQEEAS